MKITKSVYFEAAHRLMRHKGLCQFVHGHSYKVDISVTGPVDKETGMVLDFGELKKSFGNIITKFDHACILNGQDKKWVRTMKRQGQRLVILEGEPTAENIAREILMEGFLSILIGQPQIVKVEVSVWETRDAFATFTWERKNRELQEKLQSLRESGRASILQHTRRRG